MTAIRVLVGVVLFALCSVAAAHAPVRNRGPNSNEPPLVKVAFPGGYCDLYLLAQQSVQKDLALNADQVALVRELVVNLIEKKKTLKFAEHVQLLQKHQQTALDHLRPEQVKRLKQVSLQCLCTAAFSNPAVRNELQLSDAQLTRIRAVPYGKELGTDSAEEVASIRKAFLDYPKRAEEEWQMREWRCLAALTPQQRARWAEMLGSPFQGSFPSDVLVPANPRWSQQP